jgi:uncharacterized protein YpmB
MRKVKSNLSGTMVVIGTLLLTSCDNKSNSFGIIGGIMVLIMVVFGIISAYKTSSAQKKSRDAYDLGIRELQEKGFDLKDFRNVGTYVGGHPEIDDSKENVCAIRHDRSICFFTGVLNHSVPQEIKNSQIPVESIEDVKFEDATTVEKRVTLGRMLLVGVLAFALKKKEKNEMAFVNIVWKKGKFENDTTFMYQGLDAAQKANKARNELIKMCEE